MLLMERVRLTPQQMINLARACITAAIKKDHETCQGLHRTFVESYSEAGLNDIEIEVIREARRTLEDGLRMIYAVC